MAGSSKEDFLAALKKADEAGDTEASEAIAAEYKKRFMSEEPAEEKSFVEQGQEAMSGPGAPPAPSDMAIAGGGDPDAAINGLAARLGAREGLAMGLGAHAAAIEDTAQDVMEISGKNLMLQGMKGVVDNFPNISETYNANLHAEKRAREAMHKKYPTSYNLGDMAGTIANEMSLFGLGKWARGGMGKAITSVKGMAAMHGATGLVNGVTRSEEETIAGVAGDAAVMGGVSAVLGGLGGRGAQKFLSAQAEKVSESSFLKFLGATADVMEDKLSPYAKEVKDVASRVLSYTDEAGKPLVGPYLTRKNITQRVIQARQRTGEMMADTLRLADEVLELKLAKRSMSADEKVRAIDEMDAKGLWAKLKDEVFHFEEGGVYFDIDPKKKDMFMQYEDELYNTLFMPKVRDPKTNMVMNMYEKNESLNLRTLAKRMREGFDRADSAFSMPKGMIKKHKYATEGTVAKLMHGHLDDVMKNVDPEVYAQYAPLRERFGDLASVSEVLSKTLNERTDFRYITDLVKSKVFVGSVMANGIMATQSPVMAGVGLMGSGLMALANSRRVNAGLARSAKRIHDSFQAKPDFYAGMSRKLLTSLNISSEAFMDTFNITAAQVELYEKPLARSSEDVFNRKDQILTIVEEVDSDLADKLRNAIDEYDTGQIGAVMTQISKKTKPGLIEQGVGWDGLSVDPEEQAAIEAELKKRLTPREQHAIIPRFRDTKQIPQEYYGKASPNPVNRFIYKKRLDKLLKDY